MLSPFVLSIQGASFVHSILSAIPSMGSNFASHRSPLSEADPLEHRWSTMIAEVITPRKRALGKRLSCNSAFLIETAALSTKLQSASAYIHAIAINLAFPHLLPTFLPHSQILIGKRLNKLSDFPTSHRQYGSTLGT